MATSFQFDSMSEDQTIALGAALARNLRTSRVVAMDGPLGSGKTCFVRGLARGLGIDPSNVSSPTFIICQEYKTNSSPTLVHIDAYRMQGLDELETIGWNELLASNEVIIAIEWADKIKDALPVERVDISFTHTGEKSRSIVIEGGDVVIEQCDENHKCRACGSEVDASVPTFPFCSERCKLADLGQWFNEKYKVTRPVQAEDEFENA